MTMRSKFLLGAAIASIALTAAHADGDPKRGAKAFGACVACHSLEPHLNLTGPSLAGLWGKKAGSVSDFVRYSSALKEQAFLWDDVSLNAWLKEPQAFVPGTSMPFRGIDDATVRSDLIAFLKIAMAPDGATSVVAQGLIDADMARGQAPEPLKTAGPEFQVTHIRHCHDSFFVDTADGRHRPFWEMNLRLKIDSSANGPNADTPILLRSGMQGDRASVVFSNLDEINRLVEKAC